MEKDEIRKTIIENSHHKERDPHNNLDRLEFLIDSEKVATSYFELKESIRLKNSWRKKVGSYLLFVTIACVVIYSTITYPDLSEWWQWVILLVMIVALVSFSIRFLENKIIFEISADGLTLEQDIFNKWEDIEFLYFKTKYNGEGYVDEIYLIELLKSGVEHEVPISNLSWSADQLGTTLYQCMKRYYSTTNS